ncbi:MAG: hypothetical protein GY856_38640 [bacterium]|nr:hypothetical protein [bacterium]
MAPGTGGTPPPFAGPSSDNGPNPGPSQRSRPTAASEKPPRQLPEPVRFWIAHTPRRWHSAGGFWTDLAHARIRGFRTTGGAPLPELEAGGLDDLFHLPPVRPELRAARDELAAALAQSGTPVLAQLLPGEPARLPGEPARLPGVVVVFDLLRPLLEGRLDRLGELPEGSTAVWPLVAGLTDQPESWEEGCERLAAAGVGCVQATAVELDPELCSRLARDRGDDVFDALFHGEPPSERSFSCCAHAHGLEVFTPRPATGRSPRQIRNRHLAAQLALAGELWLRLDRSVASGQALFRAARGAESTRHDLAALVREENLTVMNWLSTRSAELIVEVVTRDRSSLLEELLEEYLGGTGDRGSGSLQ